nr:G-type lectin S-receptor-like serine/threonine-protein kinase At4g27290 [Ipomoea batatas]
MEALSLILLLAFLLSIQNICLGKDLITKTQFLRDGDTIVSEGGTFVLGFFSPTNSLNRYIGIWHRKDPVKTVVWVANRDAPLADTSSAVLKITLGGQLSLLGINGQDVWSANTSRSVPNPVAELLDSGNLVVRDADDEKLQNFLWQSFDHPTDHWLSGMKLGWNLQTVHEVFLTAWKGENDPASGQYTLHLDPTGYPQLSLRNRTTEIFNSGPWNGLRFSVAPVEQSNTNVGPYGLTSLAGNIVTKTQFLKDGDETIVSNGGTFEMGFFSPTNSSNRYVGIWYKQIPGQTVVWVANRDAPIKNTSSAVLKITLGGQLALVGDDNQAVWSANTSRSVQNLVAELLDTGNLVVRDADDENPENFLWQSFDFPTDHYLPGMKLGRNLVSGHEVYVTARKHGESPASGEYTFHLDPTGYPQTVIKNASTEIYGSGPWNGLRFSGTVSVDQNNTHNPYGLVINKKEVYVWYNLNKDLGVLRFLLTSNGVLEAWLWEDQKKGWSKLFSVPSDDCDTYGLCGANGVCNVGKYPPCGCLDKFLPAENPFQACLRRNPLNCHNNGSTTDGFLKYSGVKLPDTKQSWYNETMSLQECEEICLRNCSCMAYSSLNISEGETGCLIWLGDLVDIRWLSENGQDIYIRLASSELPADNGVSN